jgi:hypothetical protein
VEAVAAGELILITPVAGLVLQTDAALHNAVDQGNIVGHMRDRMRDARRRQAVLCARGRRHVRVRERRRPFGRIRLHQHGVERRAGINNATTKLVD